MKLKGIRAIIKYILMMVSSVVFAFYMNLNNAILWGLIVGILEIFGCRKMSSKMCDKKIILTIGLFSLCISLFIVLGKHLSIDAAQMYHGTAEANYILGYNNMDWIAMLLISYCVFQFIVLMKKVGCQYAPPICTIHFECTIQVKWIILYMIILSLLWLPYLYIYYPGFYFGDSIHNVAQALGIQPLDNHHPVMYILLMRFCIRIGYHIGDLVCGLAVFSIVQMVFMAWGLGYFTHWLQSKFRLNKWLVGFILIVFGASPYIGQYTICIWKDPIFSIALVLVTMNLADCIFQQETREKIIVQYVKLSLALGLMIFSRNNGIYILYAIILVAIVSLIDRQTRKKTCQIIITCLLVLGISKYIMGPVYDKWGVTQADEKVESYGIFLSQMARVVALDGNLSEEDLNYMNQLLPIEEYKTTYTPCCIDNLKWSPDFHKEVLENSFFKTYLSILVKNPKICFEAWELQTFGFWSLNQPVINNFDGNIVGGVPRNIYPEYGMGIEGLTLKTVDTDSVAVQLYPYTAKCVPIAYIHWLLIGLALFALIRYNWKRLVVLSPALGLMATLIIASPIYYWPRYGLAQQLLLPLFIIMIFVKEGEPSNG